MRPRFDGLRLERIRGSHQWRDGAFRNTAPVGPGLKSSPLPLLGEYFFSDAERTPRGKLPLEDPRVAWDTRPETGLRLTWLGHSTVLLEIDGVRVLTDPVFGERASPLAFAGPRRFHPTPVPLEALPPIDLVLLSHDHYDHLCKTTMTAIGRLGLPVVTALGVGARLEAFGVAPERITELDWGETATQGALTVRATPSQHFSGRGAADRNHTLWASWCLEGTRHRVFFSGDTGLTEELRTIGAAHGPFDVVMLEVGAWNEAWGDIHLGPKNALAALDMLGGGTLLPVHWGTFNLALHAWDEPVETLLAEAGSRRVITPRLGLVVEPSRVERATPWWREVEAEARGCGVSARGPAKSSG